VTFLIQFRRSRRGVSEVIRTLHLPSIDASAALAHAKSLAGTRHWPAGTDALRVMDEGGRTLLDWRVSAGTPNPLPLPGLPGLPAKSQEPSGAVDGWSAVG
jgi:hypothetical protein